MLVKHDTATSIATDSGEVHSKHGIFEVAEELGEHLIRVFGFHRHNGPLPVDEPATPDDDGTGSAPTGNAQSEPKPKKETAAAKKKREAAEAAASAEAAAKAAADEAAKTADAVNAIDTDAPVEPAARTEPADAETTDADTTDATPAA